MGPATRTFAGRTGGTSVNSTTIRPNDRIRRGSQWYTVVSADDRGMLAYAGTDRALTELIRFDCIEDHQATGDQITITHTSTEGTLASGDTRAHAAILKRCGWRWSRNLGSWYVPNSRDRLPQDGRIRMASTALEAAGVTVTVEIDRAVASTAEREANRAERIADRQDALSAKAERKAEESTGRYNASSAIAQRIPFGQPILVGHHSERGHRADLDRIRRHMDASCELAGESAEAARKAAASERNSSQRLTGPATLRRIERLETEQRDLARKLEQATEETE